MVLFFYIHIYFNLKTSNDLEIYEMDEPSKDKLEEICDQKQPVIFKYNNHRIKEMCTNNSIIETYGVFDIKLRDTKNKIEDDEEIYIPIKFVEALKVIEGDKEEKYIVERNQDFLEETGLIKTYKYNDEFIRPYMVCNCIYDYITGSLGSETPFRYELNYRNYYYVTQGTIKIKLSPPKSKKYLYSYKDYDNFEFRSAINPWNVEKQYLSDFDKVKCLEVVLKEGDIIQIPPYWWYSIKIEEKDTSICVYKYRTYMNNIAILPHHILYILQNLNTKRKIAGNYTG